MAEQPFLDYDGLAIFKELLNGVEIITATGDGITYTATIPNLSTLKKGLVITIIPNKTSIATIPSLNVNGLGAKNIKQRLSINTSLTAEAATDSWMVANKPVSLMFDGTQWVTITSRPSATSIHGVVPIKNGGTGVETVKELREVLGVGDYTLYVNAPPGVTVTAKKGETTYSKTANDDGLAIFESLEIGTWTVQITNGVDTSTSTVVVKPDYSVTMAFFAATINITYPAGSVCTCTDGDTTLTAPDTSGTWVCIVPNAGAWTASCTDNVQSDSGGVIITAKGESKTIRLNYAVTAYRTEAALLADAPKEDTVGIVTTTGITGIIRSPEEPISPVPGMVWILTDNDASPISATQYVSGEFVELTAMSYQGGEWVKWDTNYYLFKSGKGEIVPLLYGVLDGASHSVTNEAITVSYSGNNNLSSSVRTENAIDLTEYTTLVVVANCTAITGEKYGGRIGISKSAWTVNAPLSHFSAYTTFVADNKVTEYTLDISAYEGEYYCGIHGDTKATVYDIFLI